MRDRYFSWLASVAGPALLAATALLTSAAPAIAGDPKVVVKVTPAPATVTLSRSAQGTYAAYEVKITNHSTHVVNHVRFVGTTAVSGSGEAAPFVESIGAQCVSTNTAKTSIKCRIGKLHGRGDSKSFILIFKSPTAGSLMNFPWTAFFGEGSGDDDHAAHLDSISGKGVTPLGTPIDTEIRTFVLSAGGTIFTGKTGAATYHDPFTTTVKIPSFAKAEVVETTSLESCSPDLTQCFFSDLAIPGQFENLVITLRRDKSTINHHAKIANAKVFYAFDDVNFVEVQPCDCTPTGGPTPGVPCITSRTAYPKYTGPYDFRGDWEFVILAVDNGRYFN